MPSRRPSSQALLGLKRNTPTCRMFARAPPARYRLITGNGTPGKPRKKKVPVTEKDDKYVEKGAVQCGASLCQPAHLRYA